MYKLQQGAHALIDFGLAHALDFQGEGNVLIYGAAGEQIKVLENHADALTSLAQLGIAHSGKLCAIHENLAAGGALQHIDAAYQGGFAGAGKADNTKNLACFDAQISLVQSVDIASLTIVGFFYIN